MIDPMQTMARDSGPLREIAEEVRERLTRVLAALS